MLFHEMSHFLQLFSEKLMKTLERDSLLEKLSVWPNRRFFMLFHEMSHFLQRFFEKFVLRYLSTDTKMYYELFDDSNLFI